MTDSKDWLDALEENCRLDERKSWSIQYTEILRLVAEVRRLRARVAELEAICDHK